MRALFLAGGRFVKVRAARGARTTGLFGVRSALVAVVVGAALALTASFAFANTQPTLSPIQATFTIPAGSTATWTLNLWSAGKQLGTATGTTGTLKVPVPGGTNCQLQADVRQNGAFYSGVAKSFTNCGPSTPTTTTTSTTATTAAPATTTTSPPTSPTSSPTTLPGSPPGVATRPASSLALTGPGSGIRWVLAVGLGLLTAGLLGLVCLGPMSAQRRRLRGSTPSSSGPR
jgi:hypothetical protein